MNKTAIIFSGGLDSTVLSYLMAQNGEIALLTFDYGQRHIKEAECAKVIANRLSAEHHIIDISSVKNLLKGSSLTDPNVEVPMSAYDKETMSLTVVPNRNAIMLSIAWGFAKSHGFNNVACGVHSGDHFIYPDCRPEFINSMRESLRLATESPEMDLLTPFVGWTKAEIVKAGYLVDVPFDETWSCYKGEEVHCGLCGTCLARKAAFAESGVLDITDYATDFTDEYIE